MKLRLCSLHLGFLLVLAFPIIYFSFKVFFFLKSNVCNFLWDSVLKGRKAKMKNNYAICTIGYNLITFFLFISFVCSAYRIDYSRKRESVLCGRGNQKIIGGEMG